MTRRIKNGVKRGGIAIPLESNIFMLKGNSHKQGGIDIDRTVEAQGGEIMRRFGKDKMQILSKEDSFPHGNPVKNYLNGMSFNDAFTLQQLDNAMLGRGDFGKAKYGIETEFDRIKRTMAIDGTNKQGSIRTARNTTYNTAKKKLGDKAGNLVNVINYLYGLPDKAIDYVAKNVANTAPKSVKNASDRIAKRYKNNTPITPTADPMSSGIRAAQSLVNAIPDESYRNMATIPLMLYPGKGMRQARKGAAGTGGARKTGTPVQGTLNFVENVPRNNVTIKGLKPTETTVVNNKNVSAPIIGKRTVKLKGKEGQGRTVQLDKDYRHDITSDYTEFVPTLTGDVINFDFSNPKKVSRQGASRIKIKYNPEFDYGLDVINNMSPQMRDALMGKPKEVIPGNIGSVAGKPRSNVGKAMKRGRTVIKPNGDVYPRRYYTAETLGKMPATKSSIFDLVSGIESHKAKGASTANRPRVYQVMESNGNIYETNSFPRWARGRKKFYKQTEYIGNKYPEIVEPENGIMEPTKEGILHNPKTVYEKMKNAADKKAGKPTTERTTRTTNNNKSKSKWIRYGKYTGYGLAGAGAIAGAINAFKPRNQNAGFTNNDAYGVDESLSGRFVYADPDEKDTDTIGRIGNGMHHDSVISKIYDANGDTARLAQISDTTRRDSTRRKKALGGKSSSLRGVGNGQVQSLNGVFVNAYLPSTENAITRATNNNYNKVKSRLRNYTSAFTNNPINLKSIRRKAKYGLNDNPNTVDIIYDPITGKPIKRGFNKNRAGGNTGIIKENTDILPKNRPEDEVIIDNEVPSGRAGRKRAGLTTPDVNVDHTGGTGITNPNNLPTPPNTTLQTTTPNVDLSGVNKTYDESLKNAAAKSTFKSRPTFSSYWKGFNGDDLLSAGINTIGTVGSFLINNHYLNKMQEPPVPITVSAPKLRTRYNINPQLTENREAFSRTMNGIRSNMASSSGLRNSLGGYLNSLSLANNKLEADKENRQIALINEDNKLRGEYNARNASTYNDYLNRRNLFINDRYDKKSENWVSMFNNFNAIAQRTIDNKQKRNQMRLDYLSTLAPYVNIITGNDINKANKLYKKIINGITL